MQVQAAVLKQPIRLPGRILWLDLAKSYGMVLVFWGHIVESFVEAGLTSASSSHKLIYSFHVALFFLLAGYVSKRTTGTLFDFLKLKFFTRIVPLLFFNVIGFAGLLVLDGFSGTVVIQDYLRDAYALLKGLPQFNITTWFLMCLVSVELIHFFATRFCRSERVRLSIVVVLFGLGWALTLKYRFLAWNYWFLPAASVAYLFYYAGYLLKRKNWFNQEGSIKDMYGFLITAAFTLLTFQLNQTLFALPVDVVFMSLSSYGQPVLFLFTGISGSLAVIYLARWLSSDPWTRSLNIQLGLRFIGLNTLVLLGLNGLLFPFNHRVAEILAPYLPDTQISTVVICGFLTAFSLLICTPIVIGLRRYVPHLVGLPKAENQALFKSMSS